MDTDYNFNSEVNLREALINMEIKQSDLMAQITDYKRRGTYDWLVSMLSKDLQYITYAIQVIQDAHYKSYDIGYKIGCQQTEKKYNPKPNKFFDKEEIRRRSINQSKIDFPNLY